jgi:leucyl aminopeptidase
LDARSAAKARNKVIMTEIILQPGAEPTIPIHATTPGGWEAMAAALPPGVRAVATLARFTGKAGEVVLAPDDAGALACVLFGLGGDPASATAWRALPAKLPEGAYRLGAPPAADPTRVALAWAMGVYGFDRYRKTRQGSPPRLEVPGGADVDKARLLAHACALARDMVNTPANDMGPLQMETIAREIAAVHQAQIEVVVGDDLLAAGYPAVHAVGRAAHPARAPRMIEIIWGDPRHPILAVVGKGVVFDTGGLDIKPGSSMKLMKKDMGGGAHALALSRMIMGAGLPVRLHVLVPVVENAISGDAMRPSDIIASRKGLTIEVGNTDAEGRLILADALTRAAELDPFLTIDMATLTGAARVALGPQVIPFYTDDDALAADIARASLTTEDPLWRMPLWRGYAPAVESDIADLRNDPEGWAQAGSVTAALFLQHFAPTGPWVHLDIYAWNPRGRPGYPVGAEAQGILALFAMLEARFPQAGNKTDPKVA